MLVVVMTKVVVMVKMAPPFRLPHSVMLSVEKGVEVRFEIAWRTTTFVRTGIFCVRRNVRGKCKIFVEDNHYDK